MDAALNIGNSSLDADLSIGPVFHLLEGQQAFLSYLQGEAVRMFHLCQSPFPFLTPHPGSPSSLPPYIIRQKWDTAKEEGLDRSGLLTLLPPPAPNHFLVPPHCAHCH